MGYKHKNKRGNKGGTEAMKSQSHNSLEDRCSTKSNATKNNIEI